MEAEFGSFHEDALRIADGLVGFLTPVVEASLSNFELLRLELDTWQLRYHTTKKWCEKAILKNIIRKTK